MSKDLEAFRSRVTAWLAARFDARDPSLDDDRADIIARTPDGHAVHAERAIALQRDLHAAGFVAMAMPVEYGGHGLDRSHDDVVARELQRFDAPSLRPIGIGLGLARPTILASGTEEQKRRYLPKLVSGEEVWCQLFSEPDAGSDLVSLRARAVRDGNHWVVTGQKVWSSMASIASYGMLLARTDPDADKPHAGITMFVLPMDRPGVTVRPLVDIAGGHHFNEVFLEDVALDEGDVLGDLHRGWLVATATLSGERGGYLGGSGSGRRRRQAVAALAASGRDRDPALRHRVVDVIARERVLEWLSRRVRERQILGGNAAAGSLTKLAAGTLEQRAAELVIDVVGASGIAWDRDDRDGDVAAHSLNASRQATIAGGTHQIQRNVVGERLLGLPREPRS
ncbi:MAG: acyl-CoA dehydrogenase family protein [Acidimicrobiales bacterium]